MKVFSFLSLLLLYYAVDYVSASPAEIAVSGLEEKTDRIWGDSYIATAGQFPYYTYVELSLTCGGSLIAPDVVMTAAHCVGFNVKKKINEGKITKWVLIGETTVNDSAHGWRTVKKIVTPPETKKCTLNNNGCDDLHYDIALLRLNESFIMDPIINPNNIQLRLNMNGSVPTIGEDFTLCGMGRGNFPNDDNMFNDDEGVYPDKLYYASEEYKYTNQQCSTTGEVDGVQMWGPRQITTEQMCWSECATTFEVCPGSGDSGGPLVIIGSEQNSAIIHTQVGIVSFGDDDGLKPDVFTRVSTMCEWIKEWVCVKWQSLSSFDYLCSTPCDSVSLPSPSTKKTTKKTTRRSL